MVDKGIARLRALHATVYVILAFSAFAVWNDTTSKINYERARFLATKADEDKEAEYEIQFIAHWEGVPGKDYNESLYRLKQQSEWRQVKVPVLGLSAAIANFLWIVLGLLAFNLISINLLARAITGEGKLPDTEFWPLARPEGESRLGYACSALIRVYFPSIATAALAVWACWMYLPHERTLIVPKALLGLFTGIGMIGAWLACSGMRTLASEMQKLHA